MDYPGVFGFAHFMYLGIWILLGVISLIFLKKHLKSEKTIDLVTRCLGLLLFIFIIGNRISLAINNENVWSLIPSSFCGMSSFVLSIATMFGKRNNIVLHAVCYSAFIGGVVTNIYPDFFETQTFWDPRTFTGIMHHTIDIYLVIYMLMFGWFKPSMERWYIYPIGICITITFGLFLNQVLNLNTMQINDPLLSSAPIFTSWWSVAILSVLIEFIIIICYEYLNKKKKN